MKDMIITGHPHGAWVLTDNPNHLTWSTQTCVGAIRMSADGRFIVSRLPNSEAIFYAETFAEARERILSLAMVEYLDQSGSFVQQVAEASDEKTRSGNI